MSFFSYKIFYCAAKEQSFIRTAEIMNLTPSAVSHSISSLEKNLGFTLFLRTKSGVKLTTDGHSMLYHIKKILECEENLQKDAFLINGLEKGTVSIGAFSSVCLSWIPDIINSFKLTYPNITISVLQGDYNDVISWVKSGLVSIGFATLPVGDNLIETPLYEDELLCISPKNFEPQNYNYITISDIQNQSFILQRDGYNRDTLCFIKKHNLSLNSHFFIDDDQSIIKFVEYGFGLSIVPKLILEQKKCDINMYPFFPAEYRTIGLITQKKQNLSPAAIELFNHIVLFAKNL